MGKRSVLLVLFLVLIVTGCQPVPPTVTLSFLGDLMLGRGIDPQPNSLSVLTAYLSASDLVLANLESPFTADPPPSGSAYNLCTSSTRAALLAEWGFDMLSIANNHQMDCSPEGLADTRSALDAVGITPIGPGMDPALKVVNGLPLAFFAFDDISSALDENSAVAAIHSARAAGRVVIVSVHWGMEYQGGESDRQDSLARQFVDAGANLVWGHHPHVLEQVEWIDSAQGKSLVLFSLGNALFDQGGLNNTRQSALIMVSLNSRGVTNMQAVPFVINVGGSRLVLPDAETDKQIRANLHIP